MNNRRIPLFPSVWRIFPLLILLACSTLYGQGWQRVAADYHATDIAPGGGRIVYVGDYGGILLSDDGGATWSLPQSGTWEHLRAVRFRDVLNGMAAGDGGTLLRTTDGGKTWNGVSSPVRTSIRALDFPVATIGYALADSGVMIRTGNGGMTWDTVQDRLPGTGTGMRFINEEQGIVVTAQGTIYRTANSGRGWRAVFTDTSLTFTGVAFDRNGITGYACSRERVILKTTNAGETWTAVTRLEPGLIPLCVVVSERGGVYVGGERLFSETPDPNTALDWSDDGGKTWKRPTLLITGWENLALEGIAARGERLSFAGNCGTAFLSGLSMERGVQQTVSNSLLENPAAGGSAGISPYLSLYRVAFSGPDTGIATVNVGLGASNTKFLRTTDGGTTWEYWTTPWVQNYLDIFAFPGGEFLVFSDNSGELLRTTDVGRTWSPQGVDPVEPRVTKSYGGILVDRQRGYMGGDSLVYQTTDGGKTWQPRFLSGIDVRWSGTTTLPSLSFPTFDDGYVVISASLGGGNRRILVAKTTDAGETWREVLRREIPTAYYNVHFVDGQRGFYCEGRPLDNTGALFSTTDGGETWDSLLFDDAYPLTAKFFDEANGFVLGGPSLILRTTDGGGTWNREYPWPTEGDTTGLAFFDAVLLSDERTVVLIGHGVIARKTYPDKLLSVAADRRDRGTTGTLSVIPNPAHDRLQIVLHSSRMDEGTTVRLFDLLGRDASDSPVPLGPSGIAEIDVSGLETGAYRVVVTGSDGRPIETRGIMVVR